VYYLKTVQQQKTNICSKIFTYDHSRVYSPGNYTHTKFLVRSGVTISTSNTPINCSHKYHLDSVMSRKVWLEMSIVHVDRTLVQYSNEQFSRLGQISHIDGLINSSNLIISITQLKSNIRLSSLEYNSI